ncbi:MULTISPECIES: magnesium transporter CorA family protein [Enterococcus]|uniref:Magnesium transporter n=1 Tax=Enterococcus thailandicus TaxID=417368 RepID=A0A179EQZ9_ENTTH|nr:magnesium transporter CorA family protein [Enterococcus thailandicus]MDA3964588.1 magnesium transporter CorA family protein [Enterococcus thailandicus]MDA3974115.1 magnesium transporter CorA family protein [Enterococcus thailandicus]MDA3976723.1 magnesium transporter CorA family protein [Enterococcus thailandicus]MDA3981569.1 magnesium transporter CorA family protein [Enterococcus thailandicus]OAQ55667.1 magnesium transporter CorA [Enterococcus thailandicus]
MSNKRFFNSDQNFWLNIQRDNVIGVKNLKEEYKLSDEMLTYSLDKNERARVEYDVLDEAMLLVYNVPHQRKSENHYETTPMAFILKENGIFTFTTENTGYVVRLMESLLQRTPNMSVYSLLFQTLFLISDSFFPLVEEVNSERQRLNQKLREKTSNQNLLQLSDLEIGLVYLVTGTKQNAVLIEQIKALAIYRKMSEGEKEQLDDALIEAKQAVEMTNLASQILDQLSGTYNNLLNNNLNDTMKFLTVWSLLLTVPTIVTGFFGMNLQLPFTHSVFGWGIALVISLILSVWMLVALWRRIK